MSDIEERAKILATYIIETGSTVRANKDISERLEKVNPSLACEAKKVLEINKAERHIRGGLATKRKYSHDISNAAS